MVTIAAVTELDDEMSEKFIALRRQPRIEESARAHVPAEETRAALVAAAPSHHARTPG
jgi:hypothetical protein